MSTATLLSTTTSAATGLIRARASLEEQRLLAPSLKANSSRNARAEIDRRSRWASARDELWRLLDPWLEEGARVAVLGAGNGDDLPLDRSPSGPNPSPCSISMSRPLVAPAAADPAD